MASTTTVWLQGFAAVRARWEKNSNTSREREKKKPILFL
jgi:hypothetical protein